MSSHQLRMGVSLPISCLAGCWNRVPIIGTLVNPPVSEKNPRPQRIKLSLLLMLLFGFGFTNGYEMMHKAWSSIGEVTYCFSRSCVKFQGHTGQKIAVFDPNRAFPDYNFKFTDGFEIMRNFIWYRRGALLFFEVIHRISRSHRTKKSSIFTQIERFRTVTQVWLHRWIWNDAQSLM